MEPEKTSDAIAGFFYAYSISVMRGLDAATSQQAIGAMQGINATIRNAWFAPVFFGTPIPAAASGVPLFWLRRRGAATAMFVAALVYVLGALIPTFAVNVPMNDALAISSIPVDPGGAQALWSQHSIRWTGWNHLRTASSFACLLLVGVALLLSTLASQPLRVEPGRPHPKTGQASGNKHKSEGSPGICPLPAGSLCVYDEARNRFGTCLEWPASSIRLNVLSVARSCNAKMSRPMTAARASPCASSAIR